VPKERALNSRPGRGKYAGCVSEIAVETLPALGCGDLQGYQSVPVFIPFRTLDLRGVIDVFNQYFTYCATGIVVFVQQYPLAMNPKWKFAETPQPSVQLQDSINILWSAIKLARLLQCIGQPQTKFYQPFFVLVLKNGKLHVGVHARKRFAAGTTTPLIIASSRRLMREGSSLQLTRVLKGYNSRKSCRRRLGSRWIISLGSEIKRRSWSARLV
jgi:hypothetical protein